MWRTDAEQRATVTRGGGGAPLDSVSGNALDLIKRRKNAPLRGHASRVYLGKR